MRKEVKEAIKELCLRTKDIRNGEYKKKKVKEEKLVSSLINNNRR